MREVGSAVEAKSQKTMPKSLKRYPQEVKSLKGVPSFLFSFFQKKKKIYINTGRD